MATKVASGHFVAQTSIFFMTHAYPIALLIFYYLICRKFAAMHVIRGFGHVSMLVGSGPIMDNLRPNDEIPMTIIANMHIYGAIWQILATVRLNMPLAVGFSHVSIRVVKGPLMNTGYPRTAKNMHFCM